MNIVRLSSREEDLQKYFKGYVTSRLLKDSASNRQKWHWQYLENPSCLPKNPPVWVCTIQDRMAGHLGAIPVEVKVGSTKIRAAWAVDFFTAPEFRGKGIGKALTEESSKCFDAFLSVGNTDMSFGLFKKLGWKPLGDVPYYVKIWSWEAPIRKRIRNQTLAGLLASAADFLFKIYNARVKSGRTEGVGIERIEKFDEEADKLWAAVEPFYQAVVTRNRAYLVWKYEKQPGMNYIKFRALRGQQLFGYIVVRVVKSREHHSEGLIVDWVARPDDQDVLNALFAAALDYLKNEGCSLARCYATDKRIRKILVAAGFIKREPEMRFMIYKKSGELGEAERRDNWFITAGDSDMDR